MVTEMQVSSWGIPAKLLFFAFLCTVLAVPRARAQSVQGWWLDATGKAGILVAPCGDKLCGKPKTDIHNPDAALQKRPLCGLPMLWGFSPDRSGGWTGGYVYDPEKGKTYTSVMHLKPDSTLSVRGYIGIPLLGRSTIWTRPPSDLPHCAGNGA